MIKKFKNSNAFLKTSPKIGDKAFLMAVLLLGVLTTPFKGLLFEEGLKLPHYLGENMAPVLIGCRLAVQFWPVPPHFIALMHQHIIIFKFDVG